MGTKSATFDFWVITNETRRTASPLSITVLPIDCAGHTVYHSFVDRDSPLQQTQIDTFLDRQLDPFKVVTWRASFDYLALTARITTETSPLYNH
jgi:hypothetical protein